MVVSYEQLWSHVGRGQWPVSPHYDDEMPLGQRSFCVLLFLVVEMNICQIFGRSINQWGISLKLTVVLLRGAQGSMFPMNFLAYQY